MADPNAWGVMLTAERIAAMRACGAWQDRILTECVDRQVADRPGEVAIVGWTGDDGGRSEHTFAELAAASDRIALGLHDLGIGSGDIVSFQLGNRWEFVAIVIACVRIGAVANPLMPILRQRELTFILGLTESKVLIVPEQFRGFGFAAMGREVAAAVPTLRHVFSIGGTGETSFAGHFLDTPWEERYDKAGIFARQRPDANDVTLLMFTSGTTGEPKGVMHTANTLFASIGLASVLPGLTGEDVFFSPTPLAHITGFLWCLLAPLLLGCKNVLQDIWQPAVAAGLIARERATFSIGATPFLNDIVGFAGRDGIDMSCLRLYICGGAPVPPVLVRDARDRLGCTIVSAWGMTECGPGSMVRPSVADRKSSETDGAAWPHCELRIVGDDGLDLPRGDVGRLLYRGANLFVGYFKRPALYGVDADGWFETGDLGRMDDEGYIRITGRSKDVIIRGGENIPVVEVENLLLEHPAVASVAVVAMPDPRLGERGCAFVTLRTGQALTFEDMRHFLLGKQISRSYLPERLEVLDEMPMTPTGKIQKFALRERAAALVRGEQT
jgi:cyclohexanecarboxylate-CoA ligase